MNHDQLLLLSVFGGGSLALIAAAFLLLFRGADEQEIARRIGGLRDGATVAQQQTVASLPMLLGLVHVLASPCATDAVRPAIPKHWEEPGRGGP